MRLDGAPGQIDTITANEMGRVLEPQKKAG